MNISLSIITINYNNSEGLENTLKSLEHTFSHKNYELIVIDGSSNDNSLEICKKYNAGIDILVTETDNGIFDAMNKGVKLAKGEWLFFLNSGDVLDELDINNFNFSPFDNYNVIYGDVLHIRKNRNYRLVCDHNVGKINHQGLFYRRLLHNQYGLYNPDRKFKVADYFFFKQVPINLFIKLNIIFSKAQPGGYSESVNILNYRNDVDYFFNKISLLNYLIKKLTYSTWWIVRKMFR